MKFALFNSNIINVFNNKYLSNLFFILFLGHDIPNSRMIESIDDDSHEKLGKFNLSFIE